MRISLTKFTPWRWKWRKSTKLVHIVTHNRAIWIVYMRPGLLTISRCTRQDWRRLPSVRNKEIVPWCCLCTPGRPQCPPEQGLEVLGDRIPRVHEPVVFRLGNRVRYLINVHDSPTCWAICRTELSPAIIVCSLPKCRNHSFRESLHFL